MDCNLVGLQPSSDGLQASSNGLQPESGGPQPVTSGYLIFSQISSISLL